MTTFPTFEIGGCVRDDLLGLRSKDIDFAVEAPSFEALHDALVADGFDIFLVTPDTFTIRARFPRTHPNHGTTADFVLCRKDGPSSDGRRPDFVEAGTLRDDQDRRDFRCNSIARTEDGTLIDPHNGVQDIEDRVLRAVGDPLTRFREDGLRVLRAIRFAITKGFTFDAELAAALEDPEAATLLGGVSTSRVEDELRKAFAADTLATINLIAGLPEALQRAIFRPGLRLNPDSRKNLTRHGEADG